MRIVLYIVVFLQAWLISFFLVPLLIRIARRFDIVDDPGERKVHHHAKPLLGGVAIFSGMFFVIVIDLLAFSVFYQSAFVHTLVPNAARFIPELQRVLTLLVVLLTGGLFMHFLGLIDDIFKERLTYKPKFIVQFLITTLVVLAGIRTNFMPGTVPDILVSILWIVGVTNSFNLLDNLDGLTAGVSVIAGLMFFIIMILQGQIFIAFLLVALAGASLGFLIHNFYPSRLFMGDSGSLFLGYMFGTLTILASYVVESSASLLPVALPVLLLSIPLYDTFSVMFIRWREKRPLFEGDKRHFSHRLLEIGMNHRETVVFIYLICFGVGLAAILLPYVSIAGSIVLLLQAMVI